VVQAIHRLTARSDGTETGGDMVDHLAADPVAAASTQNARSQTVEGIDREGETVL
jgi:hypothetical protein